MTVGKEPFPTIYVDSQKENEVRWTKNFTDLYFVNECSSEHRGLEKIKYLFFSLEVGCYF